MSSIDPHRPTDSGAPQRPARVAEPPIAPGHPADPLIAQPTLAGDPAPVRNATEARQGAPAGRVRYVLTIGIVVVALGFLVVYLLTKP